MILIYSAISLGFIHTLLGPDHYIPFIMMGKARNWNKAKLLRITFICGVGHVLGSVVLGCAGVLLGIAVGVLENIESVRGDLAAWLLIGFGTAYGIWGIRYGEKAKQHSHPHQHDSGAYHDHQHNHLGNHRHLHGDPESITPWMLFIIFILGPCEPLIPLLIYPAVMHNWIYLAAVILSFGCVTIFTMMTLVYLFYIGLFKLKINYHLQYMHAAAGLIIAVSGVTIRFFGF